MMFSVSLGPCGGVRNCPRPVNELYDARRGEQRKKAASRAWSIRAKRWLRV